MLLTVVLSKFLFVEFCVFWFVMGVLGGRVSGGEIVDCCGS